MNTKTNAQTVAIARKTLRTRKGLFASSLLFGLSATSLFLAGELPKPKAPKEGISADWNAVGGDLRSAMSQYGS